ncbi:MAG: hypothetical protein WA691_01245 [Thermoplasmata archaeon]
MAAALSNATLFSYLLVVLIGFIILRRAYRLTQGVPIGIGRLVFLPVIYLALYVAEIGELAVGGSGLSSSVPLYASYGVDAALVVGGTLVAFRYTLHHLEIYQNPGETAWNYRMTTLIPLIYVVLFFARIAIETVVLNETPFAFPAAGALASISPFALYALFTVDALWGLSTGFLLGRSAGVYHEWQQRLRTPASSASPLPP